MIRTLFKAIFLVAALALITALAENFSGQSSSESAVTPQRNAPEGFRGIKWDSSLPSAEKLRESALIGCAAVVEQKNLTDTPPCSHMHIDTDDMELFTQRRNVAPLFGVPISEQMLTWSHRKFWSGEAFIYDYSEGDLTKLRAALIGQYGDPTFVQDRLNLTKWSWPAKKLVIQLNFDPVTKPSLGGNKTKRTSVSLLFSKVD